MHGVLEAMQLGFHPVGVSVHQGVLLAARVMRAKPEGMPHPPQVQLAAASVPQRLLGRSCVPQERLFAGFGGDPEQRRIGGIGALLRGESRSTASASPSTPVRFSPR